MWLIYVNSGTVLLNANVAFLAIPNIATQQGEVSRSPSEIASYLSLAASVGATMLGLLLVRQNRTKNRETAEEAVSLSLILLIVWLMPCYCRWYFYIR